MKNEIDLAKVLGGMRRLDRRLGLFALLNLGVLELLGSGGWGATEATCFFFNSKNCLYVRKHLRDGLADSIMSHGVQLEDLFEALPEQEAEREFQSEIAVIRSLCLRILEQGQLVA